MKLGHATLVLFVKGPAMLSVYTHLASLLGLLGRRFQSRTKGATAVEYGIMVAGIAVLVMTVVFVLGGEISALFQKVVDKI